jgi:hypothetical protein
LFVAPLIAHAICDVIENVLYLGDCALADGDRFGWFHKLRSKSCSCDFSIVGDHIGCDALYSKSIYISSGPKGRVHVYSFLKGVAISIW